MDRKKKFESEQQMKVVWEKHLHAHLLKSKLFR